MKAKVTLVTRNEGVCKKELVDCMKCLSGISDVMIGTMEIKATLVYTTHNALEGLREELKSKGYGMLVE